MRWLLVSGLVTLTACSTAFDVRKPSCTADAPALSRDLTYHLLQGPGDGSFSYMPGGAALANINGSYDLVTGDFSWEERGSPESWQRLLEVEGYGFADDNGDLDIVATRTSTDVFDVVTRTQIRIERVGCAVERRVRTGLEGVPRESVETGTYQGSRYNYVQRTEIDGNTYEVVGERGLDQLYSEEISFSREGYELSATRTGSLADSTPVRDFSESYDNNGPVTRSGTESVATDGSRTWSFVQTSRQGAVQWDYEVDYAGNGAGTVKGGQLDCTLEFTNGQCRYNCSGQRGNC